MAPGLATRPKLLTSFEPIPEHNAIEEYRSFEAKPNKISKPPTRTLSNASTRSNASIRSVGSTRSMSSTSTAPPPLPSPAAYPMYPGLQTATIERIRKPESTPVILNRPRRLAGTTASGARYGPIPKPQKSTLGQWTVHDRNEQQDSQAWATANQLLNRRPSTASSVASSRPSSRGLPANELFSTLPEEVLHVIVENLKDLHLAAESDSCTTCWMRDLCNLSVTTRRWNNIARSALYRDIRLVGADSAAHKKKLKMAQGCRLTMLRRTLREDPRLGSMVRSLKVPLPENGIASTVFAKSETSQLEQYDNKVASLVMACPNLERLAGPIPDYDHTFHRIFHALSTRSKLKSMDWKIAPMVEEDEYCRPNSSCSSLALPKELSNAQATVFLEHHRGWTQLQTLTIHGLPGSSLAPGTLLERTLTCLPSLKHLHLSNLPANTFNDGNLLSLPKLESLTLSHIAGITSTGLSALATRANSQSLQALHLRHTSLTSLPALARLLSHLPKLKTFSLVQDFSPLMPEEDCFSLWMMPYLASPCLTNIHWDITSHVPGSINDGDDILSRSIAAGGFPELRMLRAPNDPRGIFQSLCRPVESIALPTDRMPASSSAVSLRSASSIASKSPIKALARSATTTSLPMCFSSPPPDGTDLRTARLAAQARINAERQFKHRFQVNVFDEEGTRIDHFTMAGYVGTVGSPIHYNLLPDAGSSDDKGGLLDVADLSGSAGEVIEADGQGCTGSWNWREGVVADKKEKEKWWHTERGRWMNLSLEPPGSW